MPNELAYCEIFNPNFHGWDDDSLLSESQTNLIHTSYLFSMAIDKQEFFDDDYLIEVRDSFLPEHPIIRNWSNIQPSFKLEIVERKEVGEYTICIPKTFWLKLLQRKWKNYYLKMINKRKNPRTLLRRELTGKW